MADETIKRIKRGTTRMMILDGKILGLNLMIDGSIKSEFD